MIIITRNPFYDNSRFVLIFLVVFGHMIQPFIEGSRELSTLYMWIYTFHMPAFIFIAGFFAKGSGTLTYVFNLAKKLLIPYLIFQLLYTTYYFFIGKSAWQTSVFYPQWSLWFLFSLFSWHILLIIFKKMSPIMGISISIMIGIIVGYIGEIGHLFSLSRTFVLFPYFLLGYWIVNEQVMMLKRKSVKITSVIVMVVIAVAIYVAPDFNSGWLLGSKSYSNLGVPEYGSMARLFVYLTSTIMAISILSWIPKKQKIFTDLGSGTLYVYLLHGFFIQFFREMNLFQVNNLFDLLGLGVLSLLIVLILSSKPVLGLWEPFIEGKISIIKGAFSKKDNQEHRWD